MATAQQVDLLEEDAITVPGQLYALVSFVGPACNQRCDTMGMKIRGVFATLAEAQTHCKKLMRFDNSFDVYVQEMYKWTLIPPNPSSIENQEYSDATLNELMKADIEAKVRARQHFEERKRQVMEEGLEAALTPEERIPMDALDAPDPHPSTSNAST